MKPISRNNAVAKIKASKGKFFGVTFVKRTNGESRRMTCRVGVKKHLKGGDAPYNFNEKELIPVWDTNKKQYRSISLDSLTRLAIEGDEFSIDD